MASLKSMPPAINFRLLRVRAIYALLALGGSFSRIAASIGVSRRTIYNDVRSEGDTRWTTLPLDNPGQYDAEVLMLVRSAHRAIGRDGIEVGLLRKGIRATRRQIEGSLERLAWARQLPRRHSAWRSVPATHSDARL